MYYKHFFFDFDGMLFDTYQHVTAAFIRTLEESRNIKVDFKEAYDLLKVSFKVAFAHFNVTKEEAERLNFYEKNIDFKPLGKPFAATRKILQTIVSQGGHNYLYTNRDKSALLYLKKYDMLQYFTDFIYDDGQTITKPDPTSLIHMVEKHHLDLKECVVVGDRSLDVEGAYNAKMDGILYDVDSRVFNHKATHVIKRLSELYKFIEVPYIVKNNYHTHTARCGHAIGSDEEYVLKAIEIGYDTLGFSDHVMIPDLSYNEEYFESIRLLKEKYTQDIVIKVALECEYFEPYLPYYKKWLEDGSCDYLIFGNHSYLPKGGTTRDDAIAFIQPFTEVTMLDKYFELLTKAVDSHLFKYICHPDCFLKGYGKWDEHTIALTHKIGKYLSYKDVYVELSGSGVRSSMRITYEGKSYPSYPFKEFYNILKQYPLKFVIGCDAHAPCQLDDEAIQYLCQLAEELQLPIVQELKDL